MPRLSTSPRSPRRLRSLWRTRDGATAVEYALLLAVIALGIAASLSRITAALAACFDTLAAYLLVTR